MIKVVKAINDIDDLYINESFDINKWNKYINSLFSLDRNIFLDDMNEVINTGKYTFEKDYLPVLNNLYKQKDLVNRVVESFDKVTKDINDRVNKIINNDLDVTVVLYVGLCNGAGWVTSIDTKEYVLLGIEKIVELNWCDVNEMYGLIYHELGHVYQNQYGRNIETYNDFLWQLFIEGIAMYFEQLLVGDINYFHQDKDDWLNYCDSHLEEIQRDFNDDLQTMSFSNQRYFGDWVNYHGYGDVGYYLGARFVQSLINKYSLCEIINFDLDKVKDEWTLYV